MSSESGARSSVCWARRSPNYNKRRGYAAPNCIVLHYTGMRDRDAAVDWLCNPVSQVSCHYVVEEDGTILGLVDERDRAWHAGRSFWQGETDLNSASVGIEIVNGGHDFGLPNFPDVQIDAVIALCRDVALRHAIMAQRLLAHSDIAPGRKRDPGERFPWRRLAQAGVGLWPRSVERAGSTQRLSSALEVQDALRDIGYGAPASGMLDPETMTVVSAFQRRFRPDRVDGNTDRETVALIAAVRDLHVGG